jgi:HSP20 family protein
MSDRRKRKPFGFGFDEEFERMFEEMERMFGEAFKAPFEEMEVKPFIRGFSMRIGPDGRPRIQEFGNRPFKSPSGETGISEEREPLTDIIEGDEKVSVTVEIPGVEKEDIDLEVTESALEISVDTPKRKYHKLLDLPCDVKPKTTKATYKNGILDVEINRKEKKEKKGFKINID